jgi:hypothetical protein
MTAGIHGLAGRIGKRILAEMAKDLGYKPYLR